MKKIKSFVFALFLAMQIYAQAPLALNYQAVLRDVSSNIRSNASVTMRIDILQGSSTGTSVYAESFATSTNTFGLVNLQIGKGSVISGTFSTINWAMGPYFIKVSVDGTEMGTSQLLSVPYALYAGSAANGFSGNYDDLTNKPVKLDNTLYNTAVSTTALYTNTTGNYSTAVGRNSLYYNTTGSYNTAVGFNTLLSNISGNFNTACGASALSSNTTGTRNTSIGNSAMYSNIAGYDNTAVGNTALRSNTAGNYNTGIGSYCLYKNSTGHYNTATGYDALYSNTSGNENIAYGAESLSANTIGSNNTAIGSYSLKSNTSGYGNIGVGSHSLANNSIGRWNTAIGDSALEKVNSDKNTAIGYKALTACTGWDNSAVGYRALIANTDGFDNTAIGTDALYNNTSGDGNTAIGKAALWSNVTGNNNTAIGFGADVSEGISNATVIGYNASVSASNKVVIGNSGVTSIGGYANWTNYSDARLKENISYNNKLGLNFIMKLRTASYNYRSDENKHRRDGLIAQDVEQTLKELGIDFSGLVIDDNKEKTLNLAYGDFVLPLINAVQELHQKNLSLDAAIKEMKAELDKLKQQVQNK
jgi:hypothetical protein